MILFLFIIATLFYIGFHSSASHFFDKKTVTALKPFLAIGIVLHHLCSESVYLHEFERWGPLIVGIFFFISGYGLFFSLQNKKDYAQNFFRDRILQKILLPYIIVIIFDFILNKRWINYSFISHILNNSGPTFFPNDWFIIALIYCHIVFIIAAKFHQYSIRMFLLFIGPLILVILTSQLGYARNWWATPMAFSVGAFYYNFESVVLKYTSNKQGYVIVNIICATIIFVLITLSALYGNIISTIIAYSTIPIWTAIILSRVDMTKLATNKAIKYLSDISFEIFLVHGIIIDFLHRITVLSGLSFALVTIITSFATAIILHITIKSATNFLFSKS